MVVVWEKEVSLIDSMSRINGDHLEEGHCVRDGEEKNVWYEVVVLEVGMEYEIWMDVVVVW